MSAAFSFENLPDGWRPNTLGGLFDVQQGKALSPEARGGVSRRPFLRTRNVLWGRLDLADVDTMSFDEGEASRLTLQDRDLLVCEGGEIGRTAIWRDELPGCLYQNHIHRLRRKTDEIDPEFVMYWLQAAFLHLGIYEGIGNRTTIPNLSSSRLRDLPVPVPEIHEQGAVVVVLSKIQEGAESEARRITGLKELKAATAARLFSQGQDCGGTESSELGEIPLGWQTKRIEELGEIVTGGTPPTAEPLLYGGDIPFISPADLGDHRWVRHTEKTLSKAGALRSRQLPKEAVLVVCIGSTIGKVGMTANEISATNQQINALKCGSDYDPCFVHYLMRWNANSVRSHSSPSPVPILTKGAFSKIRLAVPRTIEEQRTIGRLLASIDDTLEKACMREAAINALFRSTLQLLMTGEVRLAQPFDSLEASRA